MKPWMQSLIDFVLRREQARQQGASVAEANTAAALQALAEAAAKKQDSKPS
jgi:hypothetical protein